MTEDEAYAWVAQSVSRETLSRMEAYVALLQKWQRAINLVSPTTLDHMFSRHIADSLQIFALAPVETGKWVDIGSGGGFPGMVCAIVAKEAAPGLHFTFIESDQRKAAFLRDVARHLDLGATILASRIEAAPPQAANILSARALAPLVALCDLAHPHLADHGVALFLKGRNHAVEQAAADLVWKMDRDIVPSKLDPDAVIYRIGELVRV